MSALRICYLLLQSMQIMRMQVGTLEQGQAKGPEAERRGGRQGMGTWHERAHTRGMHATSHVGTGSVYLVVVVVCSSSSGSSSSSLVVEVVVVVVLIVVVVVVVVVRGRLCREAALCAGVPTRPSCNTHQTSSWP